MMTIRQPFQLNTYSGEGDLPAIATLINTCQVADNLENRATVTKLRESYADPTFDVAQDLRLWRDADGELIAMAELWRQPPEASFISHLGFAIHPQARDSDLAEAILTWAEEQVLRLGAQLGVPIVLHSGCRDTVTTRKTQLQQLGFTPERSFWRLQRSLTLPISKAPLPDGWRLRCVVTTDAEKWVEMFNQTFVDHWNHSPMTVEEFRHWCEGSQYDPNLDFVIETPAGELTAFAYSEINPERNARLGKQEGYICLLGTRRGYRRLGLARALLAESLQRLKLLGMTTATIDVDSQNPSGAVKLYQSVGFEQQRSSTVYRKVVSMP